MQILYVEDNDVNRRVMKAILKSSNVDMAEAIDGQAGLDQVEQQAFDIILMDLRMPGMDGLTAIKHIRARRDEKRHVPIIVVTADAGAHIREECAIAGADEVLTKPVSMKDLYKVIGEVAARSRR